MVWPCDASEAESMTSDEYRATLKALGLTQNEAGRFFGAHEQSGRRWAVEGPPEPVAKLLRLMCGLGLSPQQVDDIIVRVRDHNQDFIT
jgi:hypothetical protein